jgi:hypothetical protein
MHSHGAQGHASGEIPRAMTATSGLLQIDLMTWELALKGELCRASHVDVIVRFPPLYL